jgi:hypothetical protein
MNFAFNRFHLVGTYGAFGSVTRERHEIVIEGTTDAEVTERTEWRVYEFKGKPGDPRRRPPQVAPYHLRLDWMMWFAALSPRYAEEWFAPLVGALLVQDGRILRLLRPAPFGDRAPSWVRARYYRYRMSTRAERRASGVWWTRELVGDFMRPVALAERPSA